MRAMRQFRHIKMMKRAGRGNVEGGVLGTRPGDLGITCPACPLPGVDLPDGWEDVNLSLKYVLSGSSALSTCTYHCRFLFVLLLVLDANFRLKNRIRSSDAKDPGLRRSRLLCRE